MSMPALLSLVPYLYQVNGKTVLPGESQVMYNKDWGYLLKSKPQTLRQSPKFFRYHSTNTIQQARGKKLDPILFPESQKVDCRTNEKVEVAMSLLDSQNDVFFELYSWSFHQGINRRISSSSTLQRLIIRVYLRASEYQQAAKAKCTKNIIYFCRHSTYTSAKIKVWFC